MPDGLAYRRIPLIDDGDSAGHGIDVVLRRAGLQVIAVAVDSEALQVLATGLFDLVVLALDSPERTPPSVCARVRGQGCNLPILIVSARGQVNDRIDGLDAGADDFVRAHCSPDELLARLAALLRRIPSGIGMRRSVGDLVLDRDSRRCVRGSRTLDLTKLEFDLLAALVEANGAVVPRAQLLSEVWRGRIEHDSRSLDVYVSYLRRKTEQAGERRLVHTIRGEGFAARIN